MAGNITDAAEQLATDWLNGVGTPTRPTTPLKLAIMSALGTDAAAGTEATAGSHTYAKQTVTFAAWSGGSASNSNAISFNDMPAGDWVGVAVYDSAATPVRLYYGPFAGGTFTATDTGDVFTATSHGKANGEKVAFKTEPGLTLPTGITANTIYYVVSATTNTFQVATTPGGSAVALTSDGSGVYINVKSTNAGDSLTFAIGAITVTLD